MGLLVIVSISLGKKPGKGSTNPKFCKDAKKNVLEGVSPFFFGAYLC